MQDMPESVRSGYLLEEFRRFFEGSFHFQQGIQKAPAPDAVTDGKYRLRIR